LRIELAPLELERAFGMIAEIHARVHQPAGPRVLLDLEGYRRGALNEVLVQLGAAPASDPAQAPEHAAAGFHGDIAVVAAHDVGNAKEIASVLRARGFRYVAIDTTPAHVSGDVAGRD